MCGRPCDPDDRLPLRLPRPADWLFSMKLKSSQHWSVRRQLTRRAATSLSRAGSCGRCTYGNHTVTPPESTRDGCWKWDGLCITALGKEMSGQNCHAVADENPRHGPDSHDKRVLRAHDFFDDLAVQIPNECELLTRTDVVSWFNLQP